MSFNPFSSFPTSLSAIPHFTVGKFQQAQDTGFMLPNNSGLQIAVSTVDTSQLNSNLHVSSSNALQIQTQMLNSLFGKPNQNDVFVKVEMEADDSNRFQQQQQQQQQQHHHQQQQQQQHLLQDKHAVQQELNSITEYFARLSGQPTFPYQPMYKYPTDLMLSHQNQTDDQQHHHQQLQFHMSDSSSNSTDQHPSPPPQPSQQTIDKKGKRKKKNGELLPGLSAPKRRSTSLQPAITTSADGSTLYGCPQCNIVFNNRDAIDTHIAIHRSERPFICVDCGAALKRKEHLDRHRSSHMTERPHVCSVCNKTFKRVEHLQRHAIIHRTDKVHRCDECGKGFNRKDHLTKHVHSHLTKKIKLELGQQAAKPGQSQSQPIGEASALITPSILAQLHA